MKSRFSNLMICAHERHLKVTEYVFNHKAPKHKGLQRSEVLVLINALDLMEADTLMFCLLYSFVWIILHSGYQRKSCKRFIFLFRHANLKNISNFI